jgi:hypothetical protein
MGIDPGRSWELSVGRDLVIGDPLNLPGKLSWNNHVAPIVAVEGVPHGVLVIDPSLSKTGPMPLLDWAKTMRVWSIVISEVPLTQAQIAELQTARVIGGEQPLDAILFSLERGQAPLPDVGGSGFRIGTDPPEGVSDFAHQQQQKYLELQSRLIPRQPWPIE